MSKKVERWEGENKQTVRIHKARLVSKVFKQLRINPNTARLLSFAGSEARMERILARRKLCKPSNMTTVQATNIRGKNEQAEQIATSLIQSRDRYLPGMKIWPADFSEFVVSYGSKEDRVTAPRTSKHNPRKWFTNPSFRAEMQNLVGRKASPFEILDIDLCGIFSEETALNITRLMRKRKFSPRGGVFFVNHMKGRDGRWGRLHEFIEDYFSDHPHFGPEEFLYNRQTGDTFADIIARDPNDPEFFDCVRYALAPIYYVCEAFEAGYTAWPQARFEYRDLNDNRSGVNMIQWCFFFRNRNGSRLDEEILAEVLADCACENYYVSKGLV